MSLRKTDTLLFFGALAGLLIFLMLGFDQFPEAGFRHAENRTAVYEKALRFVQSLGYELESWDYEQSLVHDAPLMQYLYENNAPRDAVQRIRDVLPVYQWQIEWQPPADSGQPGAPIRFGPGNGMNGSRQEWTRYRLTLDAQGLPLQFSFDDTSAIFSNAQSVAVGIEQKKAQRLSRRLLRSEEDQWVFEGSNERDMHGSLLRQFKWYREEPVEGIRGGLSISFQNGRVVSFHKIYSLPKRYEQEPSGTRWMALLASLFMITLAILMIVQLVKRLRQDLLDLKVGLVPSLAVIFGWAVKFILEESLSFENSIGLIITGLFFGGLIWGIFTVSESLTRQVWSDKLTAYDAIRQRLFYPQSGLGLFRGMALALIMLGLYTGLTRLVFYFGDPHYNLNDEALYFLSHRFSGVFLLGSSLITSVIIVVPLCLFIMTSLKKWLKKPVLVILPALLFWVFFDNILVLPGFEPAGFGMAIHLVLGVMLILAFWLFDFVTVFIAVFTLPVFYFGLTGLMLRSGGFWLQGLLLLGLPIFLIIYAIRAYQSDTSEEDVTAFVPDYMQRIYERERIQRELEIARHVQLTFLPRHNPDIPNLEIATLCLPAKEVGGDYYDFIINEHNLGIVIGDVSGKGISAAFYMTLTKGFLKAQAKTQNSPKEVLIHINELFYENAERGMFISMILAFFDLEKQKLTFARAGHNPMILRRSDSQIAEEVNVGGIALGLEDGRIFEQAIEEKIIDFKPGDEFLFYTDGLNEAQNPKKEEFGEDRLMQLIETYHALPVDVQLAKIRREIELFSNGAPQHDDMTAVLLRIKAAE